MNSDSSEYEDSSSDYESEGNSRDCRRFAVRDTTIHYFVAPHLDIPFHFSASAETTETGLMRNTRIASGIVQLVDTMIAQRQINFSAKVTPNTIYRTRFNPLKECRVCAREAEKRGRKLAATTGTNLASTVPDSPPAQPDGCEVEITLAHDPALEPADSAIVLPADTPLPYRPQRLRTVVKKRKTFEVMASVRGKLFNPAHEAVVLFSDIIGSRDQPHNSNKISASGTYPTSPPGYTPTHSKSPTVVKQADVDADFDLGPVTHTSTFRVTLSEVGGLQKEIARLRHLISTPLKNSGIFGSRKATTAILLTGPSGCGKSLALHAVANELSLTLHSCSMSTLQSTKVGQQEAKIRKAFREARQHAPSILLFEELDVLSNLGSSHELQWVRSCISQLASCIENAPHNVIVVATSNKPEFVDLSLRASGRFDREVAFDAPTLSARGEILRILCRNMPLHESVNLDNLAFKTPGFTGADLCNLVNESLYQAYENIQVNDSTKAVITNADIEASLKGIKPSILRGIPEPPQTTFQDIGGLQTIKSFIQTHIIHPLKYPDLVKTYGIKASKGALLFGPPGCGKTLIAKAIAHECSANFLSVQATELLASGIGETEKLVRAMFEKATRASPTIIFLDEFDAIGKSRTTSGTSIAHQTVVNQLLMCLDGAVDSTDGVFVLAATNFPKEIDPALLRPGRFELLLHVPMPDEEARLRILQHGMSHISHRVNMSNDEFRTIARLASGFSGADLIATCQRVCRVCMLHEIQQLEKGLAEITEREINANDFMTVMKEFRKSVSESVVREHEDFAKKQIMESMHNVFLSERSSADGDDVDDLYS